MSSSKLTRDVIGSTLAGKMEKEDPRSLFRKILGVHYEEVDAEKKRMADSKTEETNGVAQLSKKFGEEVEPALIKAEDDLLKQDTIFSIVSILEESAKAIEEKENVKMSKSMHFRVDILGEHPLSERQFLPHDDEVKAHFVKEIESGKFLNSVIDSIHFKFLPDQGHIHLSADITGIKSNVWNGEVEWRMGGYKKGSIKFKNFDVYVFANLLATSVSHGEYKHWPAPEPDANV